MQPEKTIYCDKKTIKKLTLKNPVFAPIKGSAFVTPKNQLIKN